MLCHLGVRDLAIVDNLELDLAPGMTVLSGETGAGKSLLVDALELAVGERARSGLVRGGAGNAEVNAVFEPGEAARRWLEEQALDDGGDCVVRRVIAADGRSRAFVNARPVPVSRLKALGELLLDVHGQHAHQSLLQPAAQRALLDAYAGHGDRVDAIARMHRRLRELEQEIETIEGGARDGETRLDYLSFQIAELEAQPVDADSLRTLDDEHRRLAHAGDLLQAVAKTQSALEDESTGARSGVAAARRALQEASRLDPALVEPAELLAQCDELMAEAGHRLRRYTAGLELDDARLNELDRALAVIADLARKHRCAPSELAARLQALHEEARGLADSAERLARARTEQRDVERSYRDAARELHARRADAAAALAVAVNDVLAGLGMAGAAVRFAIEHDDAGAPTPHGLDTVSLDACTNPGQAALPLARVASGGELSRIALAVHAATTAGAPVETLVFDEVDAGVGGAVAEIVGRRMRDLGERRQVLAVTHLPQVAALAHQQILIAKLPAAGGHRSVAEVLTRERRIEELARMLGGVDITERTREHAREMLDAGQRTAARRGSRTRTA